jgi:hypothetical protein
MRKEDAMTKKTVTQPTMLDILNAINTIANRVTALEKPSQPEVTVGIDKVKEKQANKILRSGGTTSRQIKSETVKPTTTKVPEIPDNKLVITVFFTAGTYTYLATNGKPSPAVRDVMSADGWGYKKSFDSNAHPTLSAYAQYNGLPMRRISRIITVDYAVSLLKPLCKNIDSNIEG